MIYIIQLFEFAASLSDLLSLTPKSRHLPMTLSLWVNLYCRPLFLTSSNWHQLTSKWQQFNSSLLYPSMHSIPLLLCCQCWWQALCDGWKGGCSGWRCGMVAAHVWQLWNWPETIVQIYTKIVFLFDPSESITCWSHSYAIEIIRDDLLT